MKTLETLKQEAREKAVICEHCKGSGDFAEHGDHDPETGDCLNCPIQVPCDQCHAEGKVLTLDYADTLLTSSYQAGVEAERERTEALKAEVVAAVRDVRKILSSNFSDV